MPNNINALPSTGALSLQAIANAFYLYRSYSEGLSAAIDSYYGDLIRYYSPTTPGIPTSITKRINFDPFHGKRYALPVPLTASGNNYNVYDNADAYTRKTYGLRVNTPGIPFSITITNNSVLNSTTVKAPTISTNTVNFTTAGTYTWTVPTDVTLTNIIVTGGGGGGGYNGGGGGGGSQVVATSAVVVPGSNIPIVVGTGGKGGTSTTAGTSGSNSSFNITFSATGGMYGLSAGGSGGAAGGPGGTAGGKNGTVGGSGGITLAAPYGVGGNGGGVNTNGNQGTNGAVLITYATTGSTTRNTLNTAAITIGTSSDGTRTFNKSSDITLINNGNIIGKTDPTSGYNFSTKTVKPGQPPSPGSGSFYAPEGNVTVNYDLGGFGGSGGYAGSVDSGGKTGGRGGAGGRIIGTMPTNENDYVNFGYSYIKRNNITYAYATNGGDGPNSSGSNKVGDNGYGYGSGTPSAGGGTGGTGEAPHDGRGSHGPGKGGYGWVRVNHQPNLPGGPAILLTTPTTIVNNGTIAGGASSTGTVGAGYSIVGKTYINGSIGGSGTIVGNQI
jgi:hypothetical protein